MSIEIHGADIYTAAEKNGSGINEILDFSSNINPLGIPDSVKSACINSIEYSNRYPDINSSELIRSIASVEKVPTSFIFASNGAAEAIYRIAFFLMPKKGLVTAPAFSEYESALKAVGADINYYNLGEEYEFKIKDNILNHINNDTDIVFLCNPNNPTGQITDIKTTEKIIDKCMKSGATVVIDECFLDFVENKESLSSVRLMNKYNNLIVLKAFTKIYAIPGIRLGYCMSSKRDVINGLKSSGPPWNVSNIAQAAGIAALKEREYVSRTVSYIKEQRNYMLSELNKLNIKAYNSNANYILFKIFNDVDLKEELLKKNILIRSCSNYKNFDRSYYRIAVKSKNENKLLIKALYEIREML
ncbi:MULTISPECIES: threonine-phosphate decarboxylase CobD [unclassified Sedimentibacter]|uniref:threonine-phosphate decarboxylase CobD n=1 Tax=unclassified Sedimentibacter TaxID=2649220 RepID=UPI0027E03852|nr:threonine-phosphate decarboxylase CobD [Sedimentibacter sp. MB35-C1]WMJ75772.1 threonine-phosphate decarboxylase CobD [Sedimentibacter sp. MB35-C1]